VTETTITIIRQVQLDDHPDNNHQNLTAVKWMTTSFYTYAKRSNFISFIIRLFKYKR